MSTLTAMTIKNGLLLNHR